MVPFFFMTIQKINPERRDQKKQRHADEEQEQARIIARNQRKHKQKQNNTERYHDASPYPRRPNSVKETQLIRRKIRFLLFRMPSLRRRCIRFLLIFTTRGHTIYPPILVHDTMDFEIGKGRFITLWTALPAVRWQLN